MGIHNQFFKLEAGDSIALDLWITEDGALKDLSLVDIEFLLGPNTLQCNSPTTATLWKRSTQGSGEIEKVSLGLARIKLLTADTAALCGDYVWSGRIVEGGEKKNIASGSAKIAPKLGDPP